MAGGECDATPSDCCVDLQNCNSMLHIWCVFTRLYIWVRKLIGEWSVVSVLCESLEFSLYCYFVIMPSSRCYPRPILHCCELWRGSRCLFTEKGRSIPGFISRCSHDTGEGFPGVSGPLLITVPSDPDWIFLGSHSYFWPEREWWEARTRAGWRLSTEVDDTEPWEWGSRLSPGQWAQRCSDRAAFCQAWQHQGLKPWELRGKERPE